MTKVEPLGEIIATNLKKSNVRPSWTDRRATFKPWREEMAAKSYGFLKGSPEELLMRQLQNKGLDNLCPPIQRDKAFKAGGWIASAAQQRWALVLNGGTAVTNLRSRKSGD
jgi:hypothetical protein